MATLQRHELTTRDEQRLCHCACAFSPVPRGPAPQGCGVRARRPEAPPRGALACRAAADRTSCSGVPTRAPSVTRLAHGQGPKPRDLHRRDSAHATDPGVRSRDDVYARPCRAPRLGCDGWQESRRHAHRSRWLPRHRMRRRDQDREWDLSRRRSRQWDVSVHRVHRGLSCDHVRRDHHPDDRGWCNVDGCDRRHGCSGTDV